jgi:HEAT repeat protein
MLLQILREPTHPCHVQMMRTLATSNLSTILERLVAMLRDSEAPLAVLEAIARRTDAPFVSLLLRDLRLPVPLRVLHNMKRLQSVAWLESHCHMLLDLDGRAQATAVSLAMASDIPRSTVLELLALVLRSGLAEGRRTSCQALAKFDGPEADELVCNALNDPDGAVQAAAVRQLRQRRLPNALPLLVARLDSPSIEVRDAARSSLAEFNFVRYRAMFDLLNEHAVRSTGALVRQVDKSAGEKLAADLMAPSVSIRRRAIEMAVAMESTQDVRAQLIELSRHENVALRMEAIAALALATGPDVVEALERAARDSNRSVAEAARQSLAGHAAGNNASPDNAFPARLVV